MKVGGLWGGGGGGGGGHLEDGGDEGGSEAGGADADVDACGANEVGSTHPGHQDNGLRGKAEVDNPAHQAHRQRGHQGLAQDLRRGMQRRGSSSGIAGSIAVVT